MTCAPHTLSKEFQNIITVLLADQFRNFKKFFSHDMKWKLSILVMSFIFRIFDFSYKMRQHSTCVLHILI